MPFFNKQVLEDVKIHHYPMTNLISDIPVMSEKKNSLQRTLNNCIHEGNCDS